MKSITTFSICWLLGATMMMNTKTKMLVFAFQQFQGSSRNSIIRQQQQLSRSSRSRSRSTASASKSALAMGMPRLDNWQVTKGGNVIGIVSNHPSIKDGDLITTSKLKNPTDVSSEKVVQTETGSKYRLGTAKNAVNNKSATTNAKQPSQSLFNFGGPSKKLNTNGSTTNGANGANGAATTNGSTTNGAAVNGNAANNNKKKSKVLSPEKKRKLQTPPNVKLQYQLTGETVGPDQKYLLAETPIKSTSGKSFIYKGYKNADSGMPVGDALTIKISPNQEALEREASNYARITNSGFIRGKFVTMYEFLTPDDLQCSILKYRNQCALVLERGDIDLKRYLYDNGPFKGKALRDASCAAAECIQAIHQSNLVWTDLKTENFIVTDKKEVKGIDLESAMPCRDNPVDYSPEACPPEFAQAFLNGEGPYFELQYTYDIWSLGMLYYELATGRGYFDGKTPLQITRLLSQAMQQEIENNNGGVRTTTVAVSSLKNKNGKETESSGDRGTMTLTTPMICGDLDDFDNIDPKFKDLIQSCLAIDPKKRPSIQQVLLHPYFLTTGIGPFSF